MHEKTRTLTVSVFNSMTISSKRMHVDLPLYVYVYNEVLLIESGEIVARENVVFL